MNKSRSNVFIMLNLIVSFFISACSSPREQVKIENGTFNINGNPEYLISVDKRILPSLYVLHRKKGCMSFFVPGHTCVRNGISEVILRGS